MNKASQQFRKILKNIVKDSGYRDTTLATLLPTIFCCDYLSRPLSKVLFYKHKCPIIIMTKKTFIDIILCTSSPPKKAVDKKLGKFILLLNSLDDELSNVSPNQLVIICHRVYQNNPSLNLISDDDYIIISRQSLKHYQLKRLDNNDIKRLKEYAHDFIMNFLVGKIKWLLSTNISSYKIAKECHFSKTTINGLRNHNRKISNLTLSTALRLAHFANYVDVQKSSQDIVHQSIAENNLIVKNVTKFVYKLLH